ncbi:MAG: hypothetical protein ACRDL5_16525 [Solirubrobacteraceae bacterium]
MSPALSAQITIRPAYAHDLEALERLAQLDSAVAPPPAPLLVAELSGELAAAMSLRDSSVIADPFRPTAHLVALLAAHANAQPGPGRARRRSRRPPAPAPVRG